MSDSKQANRQRTRDQRGTSFDGIMAALERAAIKAQRRAIATTGSYAIYKDGKIVHVTEIPDLDKNEPKRD